MTRTNAPSRGCEQSIVELEKGCAALRRRIRKLDVATARDMYSLVSDIRLYLRADDRTADSDEEVALWLDDLCSDLCEV